MNPEGRRWYAKRNLFRLYSLLMTNGQEKRRHEKCPYVDVKYVVSNYAEENQIATGPHLALAYGLVSRLEELHQEREAEQTPSRRLRRIPDGRTYLSKES